MKVREKLLQQGGLTWDVEGDAEAEKIVETECNVEFVGEREGPLSSCLHHRESLEEKKQLSQDTHGVQDVKESVPAEEGHNKRSPHCSWLSMMPY